MSAHRQYRVHSVLRGRASRCGLIMEHRKVLRNAVLCSVLLCSTFSGVAQPNDRTPSSELFGWLMNRDESARNRAAELLAERGDTSMAPAFIESLRFLPATRGWHQAMKKLTGESLGDDWNAWMEWLGEKHVALHPDYLPFKLNILKSIDPAFKQFFPPNRPMRIRPDLIVWGGVKVDGIPALSQPAMITASDATFLEDDEPVFGVQLNGDARAYPLRILDWHEMLNDVIGGTPVSLAYCTLCGSAILFKTQTDDTVFTFGSSGLLYESNKLMYDHQTKSLWSTLQGTPVVGRLAGKGIELERLPVVRASWKQWRTTHPATSVLGRETGHQRDYSPGAAYGRYFDSDDLMFPVSRINKSLKAKEWVFGTLISGSPKAYPLKLLARSSVLNDSTAGKDVVVLSDERTLAVRMYERGRHFFVRQEGSWLVDRGSQRWRIGEEDLVQESTGERLSRLGGHLAYWFGWYAAFPNTQVFRQ